MASSVSIRAGDAKPLLPGSDFRERLLAGILIFLSAAIPLLTYPLSLLPHGWAVERFSLRLPWPEIASVLLIGALLIRGGKPFHFRSPTTGLSLALFGLLFVQTISALLADSATSQYIWMLRAVCFVWLTMVAAHFLTAAALKTMGAVWAVSAAIESAIMLAQACTNIEPVGTTGNRNFAAGYLSLSLPVGVACLVNQARRYPKLSQRWLTWNLAAINYVALLVGAMVLAESRGALAALALVVVLWLFSRLSVRGRLAGLVAAVVVAASSALSPTISNKVNSLWQEDVRPSIWRGALQVIRESPLIGHGPGSFLRVYPEHRPAEYFKKPKAAPVTDHAHNEFIEVAVENGLLGLTVFLSILVFGARTAKDAACSGADVDLKRLSLGLALGLSALLCQNLVDINLRMPPNQALFWLGLGALAAARSSAMEHTASSNYSLRRFTRLSAAAVALFVLALGVARPIAADVMFREALIAQNAGDLVKAKNGFLATTAFDTDRIEAWRQLALVSHQLGQRTVAVRAMEFAHNLAPDYANLNGELGSLLAMNGRLDEAAALFARATQLYPFDATNYAKLARVLLSLHHSQQARAIWEHARKLDPLNPLVQAMDLDFR